jgi:2-polyprenyl-6-methoxyphenol hydroxylase-like FAD-dependent oxidoreductase
MGPEVRCLCIPYWPDFRFVATNLHYDFQKKHGINDVSFIVDPEDWAIIVRTGNDAAPWRVVVTKGMVSISLRKRLGNEWRKSIRNFSLALLQRITKSNLSVHIMHINVAQKYVQGRIILCGDAAHVLALRIAE